MMSDRGDVNDPGTIIDGIHNPPIAGADAPFISTACELYKSVWVRIVRELLDGRQNSPCDWGIESLQLSFRRASEVTRYSAICAIVSISFSAGLQSLAHLFQCGSRLVASGLDQKAIVNILPELPMFSQIEYHAGFISGLINQITYTFH